MWRSRPHFSAAHCNLQGPGHTAYRAVPNHWEQRLRSKRPVAEGLLLGGPEASHLSNFVHSLFFCNWAGPIVREEKGTQTQTFLFGYLRVTWGSSTWRGGGPKVRYVLRNAGKPNFLPGYPGFLPGYPGGARKVWEAKKFVFNFRPLNWGDPAEWRKPWFAEWGFGRILWVYSWGKQELTKFPGVWSPQAHQTQVILGGCKKASRAVFSPIPHSGALSGRFGSGWGSST